MKWIEPQISKPGPDIQDAFAGSLLLAGELSRRGIKTLDAARNFLEIDAYHKASPFEFPDLDKAVARLSRAIAENEMIGVWGDFDVDGQTSTALLVSGLRSLGVRVSYHVPIRARESHGIGLDFLKNFIAEGIQLLITCDTGISEFESLEYLQKIGLDVILTDHHTPLEKLPPALAVINPRLLPADHAMYELAGVGTAFQLLCGLVEKLDREELVSSFYDLVALGTIADLAELIDENRYYARLGLDQFNRSMRPSIAAMLEFAGFRKQRITESHIGFTLAPRLNAPGRLSDANPMVDFLISTDEEFIRKTAAHLEDLNARRKLAVDMVYQSALDLLDQNPALLQYPVILLAKSGWEGGVVGIAASRLVEKFGKPTVLMNIRDNVAAGSARSVEGINLIQAIQENAAPLIRFGGHPMAAGMSIQVEDIAPFREAISASVDIQTAGVEIEPRLELDAYLPFTSLSPELLDEIDLLAPFGPGNPPPLLVIRGVEIEKETLIGKTRDHRRLTLKDQQGGTVNALWWNSADEVLPAGLFDLAYYARRDTYNNSGEAILEWVDFRTVERENIDIRPPKSRYRFSDYRSDARAEAVLEHVRSNPDVLMWSEGAGRLFKDSVTRTSLRPCHILAILTPPPSASILQDALEQVSPAEVLLFSLASPNDSIKGFLADVLGLVRDELRNDHQDLSLSYMAGVLGQTDEVSWMGLQWYQLRGQLALEREKDRVKIRRVSTGLSPEIAIFTQHLQNALDETSAFRNYYRRADPVILLG